MSASTIDETVTDAERHEFVRSTLEGTLSALVALVAADQARLDELQSRIDERRVSIDRYKAALGAVDPDDDGYVERIITQASTAGPKSPSPAAATTEAARAPRPKRADRAGKGAAATVTHLDDRRAGRPSTVDDWPAVAAKIRELAAAGTYSNRAIAAAFGVPVSTAKNWPARCVLAGLLDEMPSVTMARRSADVVRATGAGSEPRSIDGKPNVVSDRRVGGEPGDAASKPNACATPPSPGRPAPPPSDVDSPGITDPPQNGTAPTPTEADQVYQCETCRRTWPPPKPARTTCACTPR